MNPNHLPSNVAGDRVINPPVNPGIRFTGMNSPQQIRPLRTEQVHSNERNEKNTFQQPPLMDMRQYQQLQQNSMNQNNQLQQNIMQKNHQRQPENLRFTSNEDSLRVQNSLINNNDLPPSGFNQSNLKKTDFQPESQKIQMVPQVRFPGPQPQIRPMLNNQKGGGIQINQSNLPPHPRMDAPKAPVEPLQRNLQNAPTSANYKTPAPGDSLINFGRKSSELSLNPPSMSGQNPNENVVSSQKEIQPENISQTATAERKSEALNAEARLSNDSESNAKQAEPVALSPEINESEKTDSESSEKKSGGGVKVKKVTQKDSRSNKLKLDSITSGTVQKNIKFFEENDTAKVPLKPEIITNKKKERTPNEPPGTVNKNNTHKNGNESGVDETPVIHLNLRSIFQVPRKVARIPRLKTRKRSIKFKTEKILKSKRPPEELSAERHFHERSTFNDCLNSPHRFSNRKIQKSKIYSSKEELLAFFENTKSWRKLSRYGLKADQNGTRNKIVHKPTTNGDIPTPKKTPSKLQTPSRNNPPVSPTKTSLKSPGTPGTPGTKSLPKTPESPAPSTPIIKKVPMNKIQVGAAPSPNLKIIKSKVGSLANTTHKPGGGNIKIESHKIDLSNVQPRTEAKNSQYKPSGGDKKIQQVKLQWSAKSKVGSLENATYKPGGGDKKIESVKLDFKEKAKPKVGSKDNVKHTPGGGNVKIENQKLDFKAQSKVGSLDNVKHKPGGGDIKIFDDKTYLRQISGSGSEGRASGTQGYGDLTVVREVEGKSAPGTPGRSTSVKIKKITTIENSGEAPKLKKITEVIVTSQTPKKERNTENMPSKVKVTYSKISAPKKDEPEDAVELVKIPAKDYAPILKPSLGKNDDFESGKQASGNEKKIDFNNTPSLTNVKTLESLNQSSGSPTLSEDKSNLRDDSGMSKFLQHEIATHEKIGEMWRERNALDTKSNLSKQQRDKQIKEFSQASFTKNNTSSNIDQQFRPPYSDIRADGLVNSTDTQQLKFYPSTNLQSEQFSQNASFTQSHEQNRQRSAAPLYQ